MNCRHLFVLCLTVATAAFALPVFLKRPTVVRADVDRNSNSIDLKRIAGLAPEKFALVAALPKRTFHNEPIPLTCEFRNLTKSSVTIYACAFWPNHRVIVTDDRGVELPLTAKGKRHLAGYESGARDFTAELLVESGGSSRESIRDVSSLHQYQPGKYRLNLIFKEDLFDIDRQDKFTSLKIESNSIDFEIE